MGTKYPIYLYLNNAYKLNYIRVSNVTTDTSVESETASGIVIEFSDIINRHVMNSTDSSIGGWGTSEMRTYVNTTIYNSFPSWIHDMVIDTKVISGRSYAEPSSIITTDKIYLLSPHEIWSDNVRYDSAYNQTKQLEYYKNLNSSTSNCSATKKSYLWWLRSAQTINDFRFMDVSTDGSYSVNPPSKDWGVSPAFRIAE